MLELLPVHDPAIIASVFAVAVFAGIVKGVVGFAMPMILLSGLSSFISPEIAISALIIPTLLTNSWQALRQGGRAAVDSVHKYWRFLLSGGVFLVCTAQLVPHVDTSLLLMALGIVIAIFAAVQLFGWQPRIDNPSARFEMFVGSFSGLIGGFSGIWGPPTVVYLTAMNTQKRDHIRIQGVIYGLGAVALALAHIGSGVLNTQTAPFSAILVLPAMVGLMIGFAIQDRINQVVFKRATLLVLLIAGLNLARRGLGF